MPYVMIPVPEEHEEELMSELLRISLRGRLAAWAPESLHALHASCDPTERLLIRELTRASAEGRRLPLASVEAALSVSSDALEALVGGVNARCDAHSLPWLIEREPAEPPSDVDGKALDVFLINSVAALALINNDIVVLAEG